MNAQTITLVKALLQEHSVADVHALMQCTVSTRQISLKQVQRVRASLDAATAAPTQPLSAIQTMRSHLSAFTLSQLLDEIRARGLKVMAA